VNQFQQLKHNDTDSKRSKDTIKVEQDANKQRRKKNQR